jgi:hypothetical protein
MLMNLTQKQALKAYLDANHAALNDEDAANAMNLLADPEYWVWRSTITRSEVYHDPSAAGSFWDWNTYKSQSQGEQGAWTQMFMGDIGPCGLVSFRSGVVAIFSGTGAQATQRTHVFACFRRKATILEKLFAVAVVNPPVNTGNDTGQARGSVANPDNLGTGLLGQTIEGNLTASDVTVARNS